MALKDKGNETLVLLINKLRMDKKPFWKKVAKELDKPRRSRIEVNVRKLEIYGDEKITLVVPGKVLGAGNMSKKLTVAAFSYSESARKLISDAGGKAITLNELYSKNPEAKDVLILK
jgi:large subunit ribosomal protein L18e